MLQGRPIKKKKKKKKKRRKDKIQRKDMNGILPKNTFLGVPTMAHWDQQCLWSTGTHARFLAWELHMPWREPKREGKKKHFPLTVIKYPDFSRNNH